MIHESAILTDARVRFDQRWVGSGRGHSVTEAEKPVKEQSVRRDKGIIGAPKM